MKLACALGDRGAWNNDTGTEEFRVSDDDSFGETLAEVRSIAEDANVDLTAGYDVCEGVNVAR